jgi:hypothetical protein
MILKVQSIRNAAVMLAVVLLSIVIVGCSFLPPSKPPQGSPPPGTQRTYWTVFPLTENAISEGGNWVGGQSAGGNLWGNVQTNVHMAFGVSEPTKYGDPTAVLTGAWGQNQRVSGTVRINIVPERCCHEVELRLRVTVSTAGITGYEAYCSVVPGAPYCHIARWNGPNGSYCNIESSEPTVSVANDDVLMATATGGNPTIITMYKNDAKILQAIDVGQNCDPGGAGGPFPAGYPGMGFYDDQDSNWNYFGFSSFSAQDNFEYSR